MPLAIGLETYIDWTNSKVFTDSAEDNVTGRTLLTRPFKVVRGRDQVRMLAPPMAGASSFTLDNESRDYSPENTASPLYDDLVPGHLVKSQVKLINLKYEEEVRADDPMGWWRGDDPPGLEGMDHSYHVNTATVVGDPTTISGILGPIGGSFRGTWFMYGSGSTTNYLEIPFASSLESDEVTVEAWIREPGGTGIRTIFAASNAVAPFSGFAMYLTSAGLPVWRVDNTTVTGSTAVTDGSWHHLVGTVDGVNARLYVDGVQVATAASGIPGDWFGVWRIGANTAGTPGEPYQSYLADVAVYPTALPSLRVLAHWTAARPSQFRAQMMLDSPRVYLRLGDLGTSFWDETANTLIGTGTGAMNTGTQGAITYDPNTSVFFHGGAGPSGRIEIPHNALLVGTSFTVMCWVKLSSYGDTTKFRTIFVKEDASGGGVPRDYGMWLTSGTNGGIHYSFAASGPVFQSFSSRMQLQLDKWYHLAIVYAAGSNLLRLYVNGENIETSTTTGDPAPGTGVLRIGGYNTVSYNGMTGYMDEFAMYGAALPAARMWEIYKEGVRGRWPLAVNILDDLPQQPDWESKTTEVPALGPLSKLRAGNISTGLYTNIRTDQAFDVICDEVGIAKEDRMIFNGSTLLLYWWLHDEDPWSAAVKLLNTEGPGAAIYEDGEGRIRFEGRQFRLLHPRATTVQATFGNAYSEPYRLKDMTYDPGLKNIVNDITVQINVRTVQALQVVWTRGSGLSIAASATHVETIAATSGNPITGAVVPAAGTDFTVTSGSVTTVTLNRTSGGDVTVFITAGAGGATLSGLQLRAQPVVVTNVNHVRNNVNTAASKAKFGLKSFPLDVWPEMDYLVAQDFADVIVTAYQNPRPTMTIWASANPGGVTGEQSLQRMITDRISITDEQLAATFEAQVEQIEYSFEGFEFRVMLGCEKASTQVYALWGTAQWDVARWGF